MTLKEAAYQCYGNHSATHCADGARLQRSTDGVVALTRDGQNRHRRRMDGDVV